MNTFLGVSRRYVELHAKKTSNTIFYHIKSVRKPEVVEKKVDEPPEKKPTRLAIGVEGGFSGGDVKKVEFENHTSIVILPEFQTIPLPNPNLPQKVNMLLLLLLLFCIVCLQTDCYDLQFQDCIAGIMAAHSSLKSEAVAAWDGEQRRVSKYVPVSMGGRCCQYGWALLSVWVGIAVSMGGRCCQYRWALLSVWVGEDSYLCDGLVEFFLSLSRHADSLVQLPSDRKIPPSGWKCEECEMTNNLWLNLTDGSIHCGRKYFDGVCVCVCVCVCVWVWVCGCGCVCVCV